MSLLLKPIFFFLITLIILLNLKLYYNPSFIAAEGGSYNEDLLYQLNHLEKKIHEGANRDMQRIYPEGFVFMTALYGLTWCNFIENIPKTNDLYSRGLKEVKWSLEQIRSDDAKTPFYEDLAIPHGTFYTGWSNYLLGKYLSLQNPAIRDSTDINEFQNTCNLIKTALEASKTPFLESYPDAAWPADMTVCMASMALHDKFFAQKYKIPIQKWISEVETRTDQYGLIPHAVSASDGKPLESARGSSQSLILNFLSEIDPVYAARKFQIYDSLFFDERLGLPCIREYPKGSTGKGDIDSGPVIWGIGGAASIVGQRTMARFDEVGISIGMRNSIEAFGISTKLRSEKKYLFGLAPMADTFIAWSNSIESSQATGLKTSENWRRVFQIYSSSAILFCIACLILSGKHKKASVSEALK